jgi:hypothetical protein
VDPYITFFLVDLIERQLKIDRFSITGEFNDFSMVLTIVPD